MRRRSSTRATMGGEEEGRKRRQGRRWRETVGEDGGMTVSNVRRRANVNTPNLLLHIVDIVSTLSLSLSLSLSFSLTLSLSLSLSLSPTLTLSSNEKSSWSNRVNWIRPGWWCHKSGPLRPFPEPIVSKRVYWLMRNLKLISSTLCALASSSLPAVVCANGCSGGVFLQCHGSTVPPPLSSSGWLSKEVKCGATVGEIRGVRFQLSTS